MYNNAILERDLPASDRADAVAAMETAYDARGVTRFAAWVHETDEPLRSDLERRGYTVDETTRAMGMPLTDILVPRPALELGSAGWATSYASSASPSACSAGPTTLPFTSCSPGSKTMRRHRDGSRSRRRLRDLQRRDPGARSAARSGHCTDRVQLHDAAARGCRTASVQSTEMAERVYAAVGFRDLG